MQKCAPLIRIRKKYPVLGKKRPKLNGAERRLKAKGKRG